MVGILKDVQEHCDSTVEGLSITPNSIKWKWLVEFTPFLEWQCKKKWKSQKRIFYIRLYIGLFPILERARICYIIGFFLGHSYLRYHLNSKVTVWRWSRRTDFNVISWRNQLDSRETETKYFRINLGERRNCSEKCLLS